MPDAAVFPDRAVLPYDANGNTATQVGDVIFLNCNPNHTPKEASHG
ncbi:hypothetical protein ACGFIW_01930 [Micromonospora sp. NPDC048935]